MLRELNQFFVGWVEALRNPTLISTPLRVVFYLIQIPWLLISINSQ
jgi:hypothetical protein